eukprot:scaffold169104_cov30-Tisochrysis_lutea.AAC.1
MLHARTSYERAQLVRGDCLLLARRQHRHVHVFVAVGIPIPRVDMLAQGNSASGARDRGTCCMHYYDIWIDKIKPLSAPLATVIS